MIRSNAFTKTAATLLAGCALLPAARAETLQEALVKAYRYNPTLTGARAGLRAIDEDVNLARANGRPTAQVNGNYTEQLHTEQASRLTLTTPGRSFSAQGQFTVPLYLGGTVRNAITASKLRVEAGRNDLRGTESTIFSRVVGAYMDVIRDSQIVLLRAQNVDALTVNLRASKDRFEVGDLTRTDVAQSEARLAIARSDLENAQAQLIATKENYVALVGSPPQDLQTPPALPGLPAAPEVAVATALTDNPDIRAAAKAQQAARYDVKSAKGQLLPRISGFVDGSYNNFLQSADSAYSNHQLGATAGATLTLPLYQGGRPAAAERQAVARESQAMERAVEVERSVVSQVRSAYASWQASLESVAANQQAVSSTQLALEGVKAENSVGARTILDILNAEQEALNAQVQLVVARRNAYVAAFSLLAGMGHGEARDLGIDPALLYDSEANYHRVSGKLLDFEFDPHPQQTATSTHDTPAQNADVIRVPGN